MNRAEAGQLLALIAKVDNRQLDDTKTVLWSKVLMDVPYNAAAEAVSRHFASSDEYLMPIHVLRGAQAVMAELAEAARAEVADQAVEERHELVGAWDEVPAQPGDQRRGVRIVQHVLEGIEAERKRRGRLTRAEASDLGAQLVAEALHRWPGRAEQPRGQHCGRALCQCTHTDGCSAGWIDVEAERVPDAVLFGPQPARPVPHDRVRPCGRCDPVRVEMVDAKRGRRATLAAFRLRTTNRRH